MPSLEEITRGKTKIDKLTPVEIEDLLGRDPVAPIPSLFEGVIKDMTVCVTGAGGSIGSELCRQIICLNPKKIILLEQSEYFLYEIDREICEVSEWYDSKKQELINIHKRYWKERNAMEAKAYKINDDLKKFNNVVQTLKLQEFSHARRSS